MRPGFGKRRRAFFLGAVHNDLFRLGGIGNGLEAVAGFRQLFETEDFDRHGRPDFAYLFAAIVDHGADATEDHAADEVVAHAKGSVANQNGCHRTTAAIEFGFEHGRHRGPGRIRFEVLNFSYQQDHFEQQIEVFLGAGRNRNHNHIAAPVFREQAPIGELLLDPVHLGVRLCRSC